MKNKVSSLMMIAVVAMVAACAGSKTYVIDNAPYSLLNGKVAKTKYEALASVGIGKLNYMETSAAQNAQHFANFVDGLLTHNDFGTLELNLAESARQEQDYKEFIFKVRDDENLVWVTNKGKPYKYGGKVQKVTAADFVFGAKLINTYSVASDTGYLMRDFIKGAAEYYVYTQLIEGINDGTYDKEDYDTDTKKFKFIYKEIKNNYPNVYNAQYNPDNGGTPLTAADVPNIANGSRLGVKVENGNSVRYSLLNSAMYFPTLLTYSTYLPVNENFYNEKKNSFGTASPDSILYCGPYLLAKHDETNITYKKNPYYAKRQDVINNRYKQAFVDTVHFSIKSSIESGDSRIAFESGNIDGFSLSPNDAIGWDKYIVGPNGTGTIENPDSGLVNSRWLDTIGSCYGTNLVLDRTQNSKSKVSYYSKGNEATVANTERALRLQEVRQMLMATIDYRTYYERYSNGDMDDILGVQRLVSTYVPRQFVMDDNGNEYVDEYYAQALSDYKGITKEQAQEYIAPGQYETRQLDWYDTVVDYNENEHEVGSERAQINELVNNAVAAIEEYNDSSLSSTYGKITFPVNIEYYSMWDADQETKTYDNEFINAMNRRYNNWEDSHQPKADYSDCTVFKMVPTDKITQSNYNNVSGSNAGEYAAYDFSVVQWGWGADYGDPLTYMNTYTYGGDWSSVFAYIGFKRGSAKATKNIRHNPETNALEAVELLEEYTDLVDAGKEQTLNLTNRYSKFAEAEVKLIEELAIYKPQVNYGQGWSLSISNSAGYEMPTSNYGLSNDRMTGMYVLKDTLTSEERKVIRAEQEAAKEAWVSSHDAYNIYG